MQRVEMGFIVIGLGSMGKRRIRCLKALGIESIRGVDPAGQRRSEAADKYGIETFAGYREAAEGFDPGALIISVPPDKHHVYMEEALSSGLHFFVEASVVDTGMEKIIDGIRGRDIVAAPSATLLFHPAIRMISAVVGSGELGKVSNIILHSGQYLPDWHTYEKVSDFYVSNPETGGGREIVPFELSWLTSLFGFPERVCANFRKTIDIEGAEAIDDTYNCLLDYGEKLAVLTVDVVSRHATRRLLVNGDRKQLLWDWDEGCIKLFDPLRNGWDERPYEMKAAEDGYNTNIGENMYIDEIASFIGAIEGSAPFPNTMANDQKVLRLLYAIEEADRSSRYVDFGA